MTDSAPRVKKASSLLRRTAFVLLTLLPLAAYRHWTVQDLPKQGLHYDVALVGVNSLGLYRGFTPNDRRDNDLFVGPAPLMFNRYNGAVECYLGALPALFVFGATPYALNLAGVSWGFVFLLLCGLAGWVWFENRWAAPVVLTLLGTLPSFAAFSRIGLYAGTVHGSLFAAAVLFFLIYWKNPGKNWAFPAAAVFMGLALGSRTLMVWYFAALALTAAMNAPLRRRIAELPAPHKIFSAAALCSGPLLVFLANARHGWFTFGFFSKFSLHSRSGVDNLAYGANLLERGREFLTLWNASAWTNINRPNRLAAALLIAAVLLTIVDLISRKKNLPRPPAAGLWPLLVCLLVFALSPFTPTFLDVHHLSALYCPAALLLASPLFGPPAGPGKKYVRFLFAAGLLAYASVNVSLFRQFQPHRNVHGGTEVKWDVMTEVIAWLQKQGIHRLGLGDTGISDPFVFLAGGGIQADEIFHAYYFEDAREKREGLLRQRLRQEKTGFYLFREPEIERIPFHDRFLEIVASEGKRITPEARFPAPDGTPVFVVYRVEDKPPPRERV